MADIVLKVVNGWAVFPASLRLPTGAARFHIEFPANLSDDQGARHLCINDSQRGYELPTRNLLENVLRSADLFIDVGAHWGFFTLQAATHPAGDVRVIAFEPDPANAAILARNIIANGVADRAHLVCAACGNGFDIAPPGIEHQHGPQHSRRRPETPVQPWSIQMGAGPVPGRGPRFFPRAADRRVIIKIDAEGYEPQVVAGARGLLDADRVALVVWERGHGLLDGAERSAMIEMMTALSQRGFRHFRPPEQQLDGPVTPFQAGDPYVGNVFSFAADMAV